MNLGTKRILAATVAVLLCAALLGCSLVSVDQDKDRAQIAAKVGNLEITKGEVMDAFAYQYSYMVSIYQQFYGTATIPPEEIANLRTAAVESLIEQKMYEYQATLQGYTELTEEQKTELAGMVEEDLEYINGVAVQQAEAEFAEDPDIVVETRAAEILPTITLQYVGEELDYEGLRKWLEDYYSGDLLSTRMVDDFNATITITDEEVRAAYDEQLQAEIDEATELPGSYKGDQEYVEKYDGMLPLYTPEGYRRVKVISIAPEEALSAAYTENEATMTDITYELGSLQTSAQSTQENAARITELQTQYATLESANKAEKEAFFAQSKANIDAAYEKLQGGASFDSVMMEYTQDTDMLDYEIFQQKGKLMSEHESTTDFPQAVKDATLALTAKGSYTGILFVDDVYYIVCYVGDEPAGARAFSEVEDALRASTLSNKQAAEWDVLMSEWMADTKLVTRNESVYANLEVPALG